MLRKFTVSSLCVAAEAIATDSGTYSTHFSLVYTVCSVHSRQFNSVQFIQLNDTFNIQGHAKTESYGSVHTYQGSEWQ